MRLNKGADERYYIATVWFRRIPVCKSMSKKLEFRVSFLPLIALSFALNQ